MDKPIADRVKTMKQSDIRRFSAICAAMNGVNLSQGVCDQPAPAEVKNAAKQAIDDNPEFTDNYSVLAACHGHLGQVDEARAALEQLLRRMPGLTTNDQRLTRPFKRAIDRERFLAGLAKAGLPD